MSFERTALFTHKSSTHRFGRLNVRVLYSRKKGPALWECALQSKDHFALAHGFAGPGERHLAEARAYKLATVFLW